MNHSMIGVFWGAFDPPTKAHGAIIDAALKLPSIHHLLVVINNHSYKNYFLGIEERKELLLQMIGHYIPEKITLLYQDDEHPMNFADLEKITSKPLCAIAGYDSYVKWAERCSEKERANYKAIAVVPRGDAHPDLLDETAFLLPIDSSLKHVSSSDYKRDSRS
ncbi:MAG: hypothetical protein NTX49_04525 [Chlamydiae bacterium]|nr:hypothetical protein [Chlamydiota bacterium]